jgi:YceI-like domain
MRCCLLLLSLAMCCAANAQRIFSTDSAVIKFVSTRNSDVSAVNKQVNVTINEAGDISFKLQIKEFHFEMGEMEDHFNKEYMESDKYPEASFTGKILGFKKIDLRKPGFYKVQAQGEMLMHNVTQKILVTGTLRIDKGVIAIRSKFPVSIGDYKIDTGLGGVIIGSKMNVDVNAKCHSSL